MGTGGSEYVCRRASQGRASVPGAQMVVGLCQGALSRLCPETDSNYVDDDQPRQMDATVGGRCTSGISKIPGNIALLKPGLLICQMKMMFASGFCLDLFSPLNLAGTY